MINKEDIEFYCKDLSPPDVERAVKFNEVSKNEHVIAYQLFIEQKRLPRQIFINGYNAMYAAAALFLAKKYKLKLDEVRGSTHKNMRLVLDFFTRDSKHHTKLISLYEAAIEKFQNLSYQYHTDKRFAERVMKDLMDEGYYQGKKVSYYSEQTLGRPDPLQLTISDAKKFIKEIVEPFLYLIEELTK